MKTPDDLAEILKARDAAYNRLLSSLNAFEREWAIRYMREAKRFNLPSCHWPKVTGRYAHP